MKKDRKYRIVKEIVKKLGYKKPRIYISPICDEAIVFASTGKNIKGKTQVELKLNLAKEKVLVEKIF